jgi:hypothetical protein
MRNIRVAVAVGFTALAFGTVAYAQAPNSYDITLCQQAVKSQIQLEHDKAKVEFGDKDIQNVSSGPSHAQVSGKGHFTKKDGTKKKFTYTCTVDSAAGRVVNASFDKKD